MATNTDDIIVRQEQNVLIVKLNRPKKKNALHIGMYLQLTNILNDAAENESVTVVVLTGEGDFYSSGNDIKSSGSNVPGNLTDIIKNSNNVVKTMVDTFISFPKILIALVNGPAIGIAATTLALCDIVYASKESYFLTPFTRLGVVPEGCSSYTFPKIMGTKKASEMLLFNHKMSSAEALSFGFVNELYTPEDIKTKVWDKIFQHASLPKISLLESKKLLRERELENLYIANIREMEMLEKRIKAMISSKSKI